MPAFLCCRSNSIWGQEGQHLTCFWYAKASGALPGKYFLTEGMVTTPPNAWFLDEFSISSQWPLSLWAMPVFALLVHLQALEEPCRCVSTSDADVYVSNKKVVKTFQWSASTEGETWLCLAKCLLCNWCFSCYLAVHLIFTDTLWDKWLYIFVFMVLVFKREY